MLRTYPSPRRWPPARPPRSPSAGGLGNTWCHQEPGSAQAFLLRGIQGIEWAWKAGGGGRKVSAQGRQVFRDRLAAAEQDLSRAAELDPADPTAHAQLVLVARGLSRPAEVAQARFDQAIARDPHNRIAHAQMLVYLTQKWNGSHERMFQFARDTSARAPEGSDLHALIISAHVERWMWEKLFEHDERAAAAYLLRPEVVAEAAAAHARSLGSPAHVARASTPRPRNEAAFWFWLVRDLPRTRFEVQRLGTAFTEMPWQIFGAPAQTYSIAQRWTAG